MCEPVIAARRDLAIALALLGIDAVLIELRDVGARGKGLLAGALEHDHAHPCIVLKRFERIAQAP